jgi:hypothetical protein
MKSRRALCTEQVEMIWATACELSAGCGTIGWSDEFQRLGFLDLSRYAIVWFGILKSGSDET